MTTSKGDNYIKCSCGKMIPQRWFKEGKISFKPIRKGMTKVESFCISCATDDEYKVLIDRFSEYLNKA